MARAIRQCVDSGKVAFGANTAVKNSLSGKAKLLVISSNCPSEMRSDLSRYCKLSSIPIMAFGGTSIELATVAGKPYPVSVISIFDAGNSGIMELVK